jgi:hypothetical protein
MIFRLARESDRPIRMTRNAMLIAALCVMPAGLAMPRAQQVASAQTIPEVHSTLLSGQAVDLPQALLGRSGVLVVGFSQASRPAVTLWGRRLAAEYAGSNRVLYFEMPMLGAVPRLLRGIVRSKIKDGVPERAWTHFLPVTSDENPWKSAVHFANADDAYVLVVDSHGVVRTMVTGDATDANLGVVQNEVAELLSR